MLELTSYGLTALAAMVVISFCFEYGDELKPVSSDGFQNHREPLEVFHG